MRRLGQPHGRHIFSVFSLSTADQEFCDIRPFAHAFYSYSFTPRRLFNSPFGRLNQFQRGRDLVSLEQIHKQIAAEINQQGFDLAFINPSLFTHVPPLLQYLKIPSIYYLHEPVGKAERPPIDRPYLRSAASGTNSGWRRSFDQVDPVLKGYQNRLAAIQSNHLQAASLLLANSNFTAQQMAALGLADKLSPQVCYLGVDSQFFYPIPAIEKEQWVLSVGELTPRKGFDFLIESLARIPAEQRPPLRLAYNWQDPQEHHYLNELASRCQVQVHFLGKLNSEALRQEYNRALLCVYAPLQEPFGLVPLEAMACGTPVVGVAEGGVRETIEDQVTGLLVERDPEQFARAIVSLLTDQPRREQLAVAGRQTAIRRWSWDQAAERLEYWFDRLTLGPASA